VIVETPREWLPVALRHRLDIPEGSSLYLLYAHMQSSPKVILGEQLESCHLIGRSAEREFCSCHLPLEARMSLSLRMMAVFQPTVTPQERQLRRPRTSGLPVHFDFMLVFG
jgi:hypothetical protein